MRSYFNCSHFFYFSIEFVDGKFALTFFSFHLINFVCLFACRNDKISYMWKGVGIPGFPPSQSEFCKISEFQDPKPRFMTPARFSVLWLYSSPLCLRMYVSILIWTMIFIKMNRFFPYEWFPSEGEIDQTFGKEIGFWIICKLRLTFTDSINF